MSDSAPSFVVTLIKEAIEAISDWNMEPDLYREVYFFLNKGLELFENGDYYLALLLLERASSKAKYVFEVERAYDYCINFINGEV